MTDNAFEAWLDSRAISTAKKPDAWGREIYAHSHVHAMHEAWQAANAHLLERLRSDGLAYASSKIARRQQIIADQGLRDDLQPGEFISDTVQAIIALLSDDASGGGDD